MHTNVPTLISLTEKVSPALSARAEETISTLRLMALVMRCVCACSCRAGSVGLKVLIMRGGMAVYQYQYLFLGRERGVPAYTLVQRGDGACRRGPCMYRLCEALRCVTHARTIFSIASPRISMFLGSCIGSVRVRVRVGGVG